MWNNHRMRLKEIKMPINADTLTSAIDVIDKATNRTGYAIDHPILLGSVLLSAVVEKAGARLAAVLVDINTTMKRTS
jgi:hypothetical protein